MCCKRRSLWIGAELGATQLSSKHISAAVNQQATIAEAVFSVGPPRCYITRTSRCLNTHDLLCEDCTDRGLLCSAKGRIFNNMIYVRINATVLRDQFLRYATGVLILRTSLSYDHRIKFPPLTRKVCRPTWLLLAEFRMQICKQWGS
jgi:hypothetical protein